MREAFSTVVLLVIANVGAAVACSSSAGTPLGSGNRFYLDVEAAAGPVLSANDAAADPDSPFGRVDGSNMYGRVYDSYPTRTICLPADASVAPIGEGGVLDGSARLVDGSANGSAGSDSGGYAPDAGYEGYADSGTRDGGCESFPSACASTPSCECLLNTLAPEIPCPYPHCAVNLDKSGFNIYCPQ